MHSHKFQLHAKVDELGVLGPGPFGRGSTARTRERFIRGLKIFMADWQSTLRGIEASPAVARLASLLTTRSFHARFRRRRFGLADP